MAEGIALMSIQSPILCFICYGRKVSDNTEYFLRLFDPDTDDGETKASQLLSTILGRPLTQDTVHSPLLCRPCAQLCDDYETLLNRLESIRLSIIENYNETIDVYCMAAAEAEQHQQLQQLQLQIVEADQTEPINNINLEVAVNEMMSNLIDEQQQHQHQPTDQLIGIPAYAIQGQTITITHPEEVRDEGGSVNYLLDDDLIEMVADEHNFNEMPTANDLINDDVIHLQLAISDGVEDLNAVTVHEEQHLQSNLLNAQSMRPLFLRDGQCFLCQLCPTDGVAEDVYNSETIVTHLREVHDERVYICDICNCDYRQRDDLLEHLQVHATDEFDDDGNDDIFDSADENDAHLGDPDAGDCIGATATFVCTVCPNVFVTLRQLRLHKRQHYASAQKTFVCSFCDKRFKSNNMLLEHANTHTGERPFKCAECPKDFTSKYTLSAHQKIHSARGRPFECDTCPKRFFSPKNLAQHVRTHSGVRQHVCTECGKAFGTAHNLDVHRIVHTGEKPFNCRICDKAFARRAEIRDHERTHTGEKPYVCDDCGAPFAQRSNLMSHRRATHLNEKRYKCGDCEKSFKRRRLLDYHIKASHTGERPYECVTCGATFIYPEHYKKHMRIHSGVKPYECEVCGKAFNSRDNRNAHRFVHSDKKPYECLCCGQGFMRKPLLLAHMKVRQHESKRIVVNRPRIMNKGVEASEGEVEADEDEIEDELDSEVVELGNEDEVLVYAVNDGDVVEGFEVYDECS